MGEVPAVADPNRTVIARRRRAAAERAGQAVQRRDVRSGPVGPFAFRIRHEAGAKQALAVVEPGRPDDPVLARELDIERNIDEWVPFAGTVEDGLE